MILVEIPAQLLTDRTSEFGGCFGSEPANASFADAMRISNFLCSA